MVRPDVTLYGEFLPHPAYDDAVVLMNNADMLIIGGTSLVVYPAAGMIRYFRGDKLVLLNKSATSADEHAALCIRESIGQVLKQIEVK
jgi:NAD-dependent deacetylase